MEKKGKNKGKQIKISWKFDLFWFIINQNNKMYDIVANIKGLLIFFILNTHYKYFNFNFKRDVLFSSSTLFMKSFRLSLSLSLSPFLSICLLLMDSCVISNLFLFFCIFYYLLIFSCRWSFFMISKILLLK